MNAMTPIRTPLIEAKLPQDRTLWIKNEGAQPSGSFKIRGPSHFLSVNDIPSGSVTTASTGNHAIGLSMAARAHGIKAIIMVPESTPAKKLEAIRRAGGEVRLINGDYEMALACATTFAEESGAQLVPSYDHPDIIAGNRAVFSEIQQEIDTTGYTVFAPIGGGGLFSGAITAFETDGNSVIGVELSPYERVQRIVWDDAGDLPPMSPPPPSTEGVAIRTLGKLPAKIMRNADLASFTSVSVAELRNTCCWLWHEHKIRAELGGCTAVAAALRDTRAGHTAIAVVSGSNIDPALHAQIVSAWDAHQN